MAQTDLGNTVPNPTRRKPKKCRKWCFTLNNWTEIEEKEIISNFGTMAQYILGHEVGEEGTPHIQGYLEFKNAVHMTSLKKVITRAHFETARGSSKQNYDYCSKDGDFITNMDFRTFKEKLAEKCLKKYEDVEWRPWQQQILDLENDERTINWFWEREGNVGKSFLCKYIALTRNVCICEGKKSDIFNQVNMMLEEEKYPEVVICDIPRTNLEYINYGALEQLKNGMLYSGKYEGGVCIFPPPLVICLANETPNIDAMSRDRWNIVCINDDW